MNVDEAKKYEQIKHRMSIKNRILGIAMSVTFTGGFIATGITNNKIYAEIGMYTFASIALAGTLNYVYDERKLEKIINQDEDRRRLMFNRYK